MKSTTFALAALAQLGSAHYFFDVSVVNGAPSQQFQFIRKFTRPTAFNPIKFSSNPPEDIRDNSLADGDDIVCNQGAFSNAGSTDVLEVAAGSEVSVKLGVGARMEHPGKCLQDVCQKQKRFGTNTTSRPWSCLHVPRPR